MARKLGNVPIGTVLHLQESGVYQDYIVVHQGLPSSLYDASCNGTWLTRKNISSNVTWGTNNYFYPQSELKTYMDEWVEVYESSMLPYIHEAKIPYYDGWIFSGSNGLPATVFPLSASEIGDSRIQDGAVLSYFSGSSAQRNRIFNYNGSPSDWFTRTGGSSAVKAYIITVNDSGDIEVLIAGRYGALPTIIVNPDVLVDDNNNKVGGKRS